MTIDDYFHKTLFTSTIIVGPALTMTLPFVYWVQYKNMLLFPSIIYYVVATGSISSLLYFFLFILPNDRNKRRFKEDSKTHEVQKTPEPIIYNKVEDASLTLPPSVPNTVNQSLAEETAIYKRFYLAYVEKYVRKYISDEDAQILLDNIYLAIDYGSMDLITEGNKNRLPFEVKTTSRFTSLNTEDLCHIGFVVKFFLKKRNNYGATFIKEVFPYQLKDVELSTLETKLASNESPTKHIPIPDICWPEHGSLSKKFNGQITEELIQKI